MAEYSKNYKSILILTEAFDEGGTEVAMLSLIDQLLKLNYKIKIMCIHKGGTLLDQIPNQIPIEEISFKYHFFKYIAINREIKWNDISSLPYNIFAIFCKLLYPVKKNTNKLYKKMLTLTKPVEERFDVVLDFYGYGNFLTAYAVEQIQAKKKATWVHATFVCIWDKVIEYLKEFDKIYCVSNAVCNVFNHRFEEFSQKTEVFYNLTDPNKIIHKSKQSAELITKDNKLIFLTIGRLERVKSIDFAIKVAKVLKERDLKFIWYVIGDGTLKNVLEQMIKKEGIEDCFILLGRRDNVCPYLMQCDIYIQPSNSEGYSTTVLEARILKRVIIATDIGSNREQIISGETGYLAKYDINEFVKVILMVSNDKDKSNVIKNYLRNETIYFLDELEKLKRLIE